jgi:hypothetical protein
VIQALVTTWQASYIPSVVVSTVKKITSCQSCHNISDVLMASPKAENKASSFRRPPVAHNSSVNLACRLWGLGGSGQFVGENVVKGGSS